ncbi:MAG: 23S rRNA (pseudouridine(1915)-N(3))-methyltransferase RlmH [Myxococcaceae bacterium]
MKLTFLSVGKDRSGLFSPGVDEYVQRLGHHAKVAVHELPESGHSGVRAKEDEGERLLKKLSERDVLVALDERGKALGSIDFAKWLGRQQESARDVAFVIGGDEGLSDAVRQKATLVLSLSAMTLPHRLARLVLVEQVYRAFSILRGEPYHKA